MSQEIHSIIPHIEFEHIKGKENVLANTLSRVRYLGLHEDNNPEDSGHNYGKLIWQTILTWIKTQWVALIAIKM